MKTEWQDFNNITNKPDDVTKIEVIIAKEKPTDEIKGFIMTTNFDYRLQDDEKLWVRFWAK